MTLVGALVRVSRDSGGALVRVSRDSVYFSGTRKTERLEGSED